MHISPDKRDSRSRYAAALVRDLDCDVFLAVGNDDLDRRIVFAVYAVRLDCCSERVFEDLKKHVVLQRDSLSIV